MTLSIIRHSITVSTVLGVIVLVIAFLVILSVIMLRVVMLNVIMLVSWRHYWSAPIPSAHKYETRVGVSHNDRHTL
jgi:hypothetical protein